MVAAAMKHMASNFAKLDKFEGVDFRKWQKKMHFLLSSMSVVHSVESSKELWDSLEAKYMADDASSKKFLFSNFTNYKMTDSRPVMEQYNELLGILGRFTQHKMNMDKAIQVSCIIEKLHPSWKYFKHTLKHLKEELTLFELGSHLRIEESPRGEVDPNKKAKPTCWKCGKTGHIKRDCKGVNFGNKVNGSGTKGSVDGLSNSLKDDDVAWWVESGANVHVCKDRFWFKTYESLNDGYNLIHRGYEVKALVLGCGYVDLRAVVRPPNQKLKTLGERGIECIFVGYAEHSKAFRFFVIEPNESVSINPIIESRDDIFDENRFSLVSRQSFRIPNVTGDISGWSLKRPLKRLQASWLQMDLQKKTQSRWNYEKFKARLVIQGFRQKSKINYFDTYAPVARISTIRLLIAMASIHNLIIHQMDVKTAL
ncbi:zinc finger, CCHC-type containing protein [Tanacetum coccineum]